MRVSRHCGFWTIAFAVFVNIFCKLLATDIHMLKGEENFSGALIEVDIKERIKRPTEENA